MEKYYTVEQVSKLLSLHPKTVQRYIREGKLQANKIGKSWRISGHDLSNFAEETDKNAFSSEKKTVVSSVADIYVDDSEEGGRIANMLTALLNSKFSEYENSSIHTQYFECENKLRVTLWGNIDFMKSIFEILSDITQK